MATATKGTKTALKNARDCIKNKEYKEALKFCKVGIDFWLACSILDFFNAYKGKSEDQNEKLSCETVPGSMNALICAHFMIH